MTYPEFDNAENWHVYIYTGSMEWCADGTQPFVVPLPGQIFHHPMGCLCRCDSLTAEDGVIIKATVLEDGNAINAALIEGY